MAIVSLHSNRTMIKTERQIDTRELGIVVIILTMLLVDRRWIQEFWIKKAVESFKQGLQSHIIRSVEYSVTESNVDYDSPVQEISKKNISTWPRDHFVLD